jgi:hypothetical protein
MSAEKVAFVEDAGGMLHRIVAVVYPMPHGILEKLPQK